MTSQKDEQQNCFGDHIRMCVIVTVDITLLHLCRGRFEYLSAHGFDITVVCGPTPHAAQIESRGVRLFTAPLNRAITPLADLAAIWRLYRFLSVRPACRFERPGVYRDVGATRVCRRFQ